MIPRSHLGWSGEVELVREEAELVREDGRCRRLRDLNAQGMRKMDAIKTVM